ncbi:hypothetical protein [Deinococcus puniceus]|uniref:Uncharacterized protein n=1 Tax=Deinococcus puniceus TaxID=1182568 RepID=A0A172TA65_9DEIO|nr:hypothetical protein [Deinococcus puniceus]ANE43910.1 hypothetical protein SU48_09135 [Deinococcus puniceus]
MTVSSTPAPTQLQPQLPATPHDLKTLTREVRALRVSLRELAASDSLERLLKLIPRPGWTTPAEFELVRGSVAQMQAQVDALHTFQRTVLKGSELVGRGG